MRTERQNTGGSRREGLCYTIISFPATFFVLNPNKSKNTLSHLPETDIQGAISVGFL